MDILKILNFLNFNIWKKLILENLEIWKYRILENLVFEILDISENFRFFWKFIEFLVNLLIFAIFWGLSIPAYNWATGLIKTMVS